MKKEHNNNSEALFKEMLGDIPEEKRYISFWVILAGVIMAFWILSLSSSTKPNEQDSYNGVDFDFSKGADHYGNWKKGEGLYVVNYLGATASQENHTMGTELVFTVRSSDCTEEENSGFESIINFNATTPVKYKKICRARGLVSFYPYNKEENQVAIDIFKKAKSTVLVDIPFVPRILGFSPIGFTATYNFMSGKEAPQYKT